MNETELKQIEAAAQRACKEEIEAIEKKCLQIFGPKVGALAARHQNAMMASYLMLDIQIADLQSKEQYAETALRHFTALFIHLLEHLLKDEPVNIGDDFYQFLLQLCNPMAPEYVINNHMKDPNVMRELESRFPRRAIQ